MTATNVTSRDGLSRRSILAGSAGLSFAFALGLAPDGESALAQGAASGRLNAYVRIAPDGTITIVNPAAEMGQGVNTAIPLIIAEELDADWSKVKVEAAPVNEVYNHPILRTQMVVASISVRGYWMPCRTAGAQARRVLMEAAAGRWSVPLEELSTEPSVVVHKASNRRLTYGEIAAFAQIPEKMPEIKPDQLKPVSQFRLLGKDVTRIDVAAKSTGKEIYAIDVRVPGMLYGTLARRPGARFRPGLLQPRRGEGDARNRRGRRPRAGRRNHRRNHRGGVRSARQAEGAMEGRARLQDELGRPPARNISPRRATQAPRALLAATPAMRWPPLPARRAFTPATSPPTTFTTRRWSRTPASPR